MAATTSQDVAIDVGRLWKQMEGELSRFNDSVVRPREPPTIHRVPDIVRDQDGAGGVYDPCLVAVGPYHQKNLALRSIKFLYLKDLFERAPESSTKLMDCINAVSELERDARDQYAEDVGMKKEEFVKMLVLDGCFVLEVLMRYQEKRDKEPPLADVKRNELSLRRDLLLMENQIPFFIIDAIHKITCGVGCQGGSLSIDSTDRLLDMAIVFVSRRRQKDAGQLSQLEGYGGKGGTDPRKVGHLLHLYYLYSIRGLKLVDDEGSSEVQGNVMTMRDRTRSCVSWLRSKSNNPQQLLQLPLRVVHLPRVMLIILVYAIMLPFLLLMGKLPRLLHSSSPADDEPVIPRMIPSAAELIEAGVRIQKRDLDDWRFSHLDVRFQNGTLEIPHLSIETTSNTRIRNLLEVEVGCRDRGYNSYSAYIVFMGSLINSQRDVDELQNCGVLESVKGSDEDVAKFFNRLRPNTYLGYGQYHYLHRLFGEVTNYCQVEHHRWRAAVMRDKFNNPWAVISLFVGFSLLVMTAMQTAYSIAGTSGEQAKPNH